MPKGLIYAALVVLPTILPAHAQENNLFPGVRARVEPVARVVPIGKPVWIRFRIENTSDEPITLTVPGLEPEIPSPEIGLPMAHIFSGESSSGVVVTNEGNRSWERPTTYRPAAHAPILMIAPHSSVGSSVDLRTYYTALRAGGRYRVQWRPYNGQIVSDTATVTIAPRKQVKIVTDQGTMTLELFYDDAPRHVENFMDLVESGFYTGKTFHRIEPGYLIQGGCPRGDGSGIRPDGKRIRAEFNTHIHRKGSVSMALLDDDPDSGSCQFFISNTRQKDWDGRYTVFAQLVGEDSFTTLDHLMNAEVDDEGRPVKSVYMRSVQLIDAPSEPLPAP